MSISISEAIISLGGSYADFTRIVGNTYDGIDWVDGPTFTQEEVEAEYQRLLQADEIHQVTENRRIAYQKESDPIFFKAQRGEAELSEWEARVEEIRQRFPYPPA
jgi:hypothetical protein